MDWRLAIDFGTTATAAAIHQGEAEIIQIEGMGRLPSLVMLGADGAPVAGAAAERQAAGAPDRVERTPKRRLGDRTLLLGGQAADPVDLVAAVLRLVAVEARRHQGGSDPAEVVLTHPASWAGHRLAALREAARRAGLGEVTLLPEPVAAAMHLADARISVGDHVAVYDLGGGTLDCAVLRRTANGFEPVGAPGGDERLGGEHFDELLYDMAGQTLAARDPDVWEQLRTSEDRSWVRANVALRSEVRLAKEALASTSEYVIYAPSPIDQEIRITRAQLEELLRAPLERTVDELVATIERAGLTPADVKAVYLAGGSSRMPLVTELLSGRTGLAPFTWGDPKAAVALGAASWSGRFQSPVVLVAPADIGAAEPTFAGLGAASSGPPAGPAVAASPRRPRRPAALAGVVGLVVALLAGGIIAFRPGGKESPRPLHLAFPAVDSDGLRTTRAWTFDPATRDLANAVTVSNTTSETRTFGVFEVIPKELAARAADVRFDPQPTEIVQADPVVRYDVDLAAGQERTLRWTVALTGKVDQARLQELADLRDAAEKNYRDAAAAALAAGPTSPEPDGTGSPPGTGTSTPAPIGTKPVPSKQVGTTSTQIAPTTTTPTTVGSDPAPVGTSDTTQTSGTTPAPAATAPAMAASFKTANPQGAETRADGEYSKITVDLSWAPPGDNGGAPVTGYVVRCTTMAAGTVYADSTPVPCRNGVQIATAGATATGTSVTVDRLDPASTWIKWEIAAVNSVGTGTYRTAQVVVPDVVGQPFWHAYQFARILGLQPAGSEKGTCTPTERVCKQGLVAGSLAASGSMFGLEWKP